MSSTEIRTSSRVRQDFLDFYKSKQHTIVPSSSLLPDAPNLLFTNAGMNQFVPIFLGQVKCPYTPGRAADTQKCIRAGGKHNDLEDVGLDTYHHTFFEMLGNWSFGDYFKKEAIEWAWELVVGVWGFPVNRLYATVYQPGPGEPAELDQEAYDHWARLFTAAGLDPKQHICTGGKKDNFWMMGDTGPCGPCSELHVDLTPAGDTKGSLVNQGDARCIEIWNLVFMQFNANPDGTFAPLPARSVDTGMGFERVTSILQCTKNFTDFTGVISNYETDIFRPIFDKLEQLSGKKYGSTLPPNRIGEKGSQVAEIISAIPAGKVMTYGGVGKLCQPPIEFGPAVASSIKAQQSALPWHRVVSDSGALTVEKLSERQAAEQQALLRREGVRFVSENKVDMSQSRLLPEQFDLDVSFRVIADHIRTLGFAIADGIQPGNTDRSYVLRRILRRAVRYGRSLGFHEPFFYQLVDVLADTMGDVFPEIRARQKHVQDVIRAEEEAFNKTLDRGIFLFNQNSPDQLLEEKLLEERTRNAAELGVMNGRFMTDDEVIALARLKPNTSYEALSRIPFSHRPQISDFDMRLPRFIGVINVHRAQPKVVPGKLAFELYDTYGFPLDLTELMARERGLTVDTTGFEKLMEEQRARARAAQKKTVIKLADAHLELLKPTEFVGYDRLEAESRIQQLREDASFVATDTSPFYAEMGGQVSDTGVIELLDAKTGSRVSELRIVGVKRSANDVILHQFEGDTKVDWSRGADRNYRVRLRVDADRRAAIQRHHSVTHLLHWALHEVVSKEASQKGSFVGADKLTFDFNHAPLTPQQVADVEKLVNERIVENAPVTWLEAKYDHIKDRKDVMQFFGEKYGDWVRVVQIGGQPTALDGYSMELCGGTHCRATGEIGLFRIVAENAIAAGVRRIEAIAGLEAWRRAGEEVAMLKNVAERLATPIVDLDKKIENLLAQQKELEKQVRTMQQKEAAGAAKALIARATVINGVPALIERFDADGDTLQGMVNELKGQFKGVIVLGGAANNAVALIASVSPEFTAKVQAGKIIQQIAPIMGGKGGGRPDNARGGGKEVSKLDEALAKARSLLG